MGSIFQSLLSLPPHGLAALGVLLLYAIQSEVRFGRRARAHSAGSSDRGSTFIVSVSALVPVVGFVIVMKATSQPMLRRLPDWLWSQDSLPGVPGIVWLGVGAGVLGLLIRLWAVLTLKERYTRTLRIDEGHSLARAGPYRFVRHPGYLGSLLCLDGIALATGNAFVLAASLVATGIAYMYRIRVEDKMLVAVFGKPYERYRREVRAIVPYLW